LDRSFEGATSADLRQISKRLTAHCNQFRGAIDRAAWWQVISTAVPFFTLVALMFWFATSYYFISLALAIPAGALLTRFFALQHDCGHGSLFSRRPVNEWMGRAISVLTFTPYDHWRRSHALHHKLSGNLNERGFGDITTMTVEEYRAAGFWERVKYRIYRNPIIVLLIGPPVFFLILQRLAIGSNMPMRHSLRGILVHDLVLLLAYGTVFYLAGWLTTLMVLLPLYFVATWIGGWLFYVQHQFEDAHWETGNSWDMKIAAIKGSSYLVMPAVLNWFTCDIGIHHIHHLCSHIPNYRLRECLNASTELQTIAPKLTIWEGLKAGRLALWDEAAKRLITFREFAALSRMVAQPAE
jgi:acyl-lipid omega-6 desaturase (Delta-12 desaturase)